MSGKTLNYQKTFAWLRSVIRYGALLRHGRQINRLGPSAMTINYLASATARDVLIWLSYPFSVPTRLETMCHNNDSQRWNVLKDETTAHTRPPLAYGHRMFETMPNNFMLSSRDSRNNITTCQNMVNISTYFVSPYLR